MRDEELEKRPAKPNRETVKFVLEKHELDLSEEAMQFITKGAMYLMKCHRKASEMCVNVTAQNNKLIMLNQALERRIAELEGREYKP